MIKTALMAAVGLVAFASTVCAQARIETGLLECSGRGGLGLIFTSRKEFTCTFTSASGKALGRYRAVVTKFGLDLGATNASTVVWGVFAPAGLTSQAQRQGALEGTYVGVGANASVGVGLSANALVGGGDSSFALQPLSVGAQTGLNLAVGVEELSLTYLAE